jgi:hypothetical protein
VNISNLTRAIFVQKKVKKFYINCIKDKALVANYQTEYCGQAPNAPLYIREVPGSNPGAAAWPSMGFFQRFPHTITSWYVSYHMTDKANLSILPTSCHPESSRQCGWKDSGKPQQPAPPSGGIKDVYPFLFSLSEKVRIF